MDMDKYMGIDYVIHSGLYSYRREKTSELRINKEEIKGSTLDAIRDAFLAASAREDGCNISELI